MLCTGEIENVEHAPRVHGQRREEIPEHSREQPCGGQRLDGSILPESKMCERTYVSLSLRMPRWAFVAGAVFATVLQLTGCPLVDDGPPPFILHGVRSATGTVAGFHDAVGVYIDIQNSSQRTITELHAEFHLFDANGRAAPRTGSNFFEVTHGEPLAPDKRREICFALDDAFFYVPDDPLRVERLVVTSVTFDDGGEWQDRLGLYMWVPPGDGLSEEVGG